MGTPPRLFGHHHYDRQVMVGKSKVGVTGLDMWRPVLTIFYIVCLIVMRVGSGHLPQKYGIYSDSLAKISSLMITVCNLHLLFLANFIILLYFFTDQNFGIKCSFIIFAILSSTSGLYTMTLVTQQDILTPMETLSVVRETIQSTKKIPHWLHQTQLKHKCCGILGFKDYRAFLYGPNHQKFKEEDVPFSCCHDERQARQNKCFFHDRQKRLTSSSEKEVNYNFTIDGVKYNEAIVDIFVTPEEEINDKSDGRVKNVVFQDELPLTIETMEKIYGKSFGSSSSAGEQLSNHFQKDDPLLIFLAINSAKIGNYHTKGCYNILVEQTMTLYKIYFCSLTFLTLVSGILVVVGLLRSKKNNNQNDDLLMTTLKQNQSIVKKK